MADGTPPEHPDGPDELGVDEATKQRARGWVLGPASFGLTHYAKAPSMLRNQVDAIEQALGD